MDFKNNASRRERILFNGALVQNADSMLWQLVIPEGYCNSSINVWERLIDPNETLR